MNRLRYALAGVAVLGCAAAVALALRGYFGEAVVLIFGCCLMFLAART